MSILVIDQIERRKSAIEFALLQAGLLLTERLYGNNKNLVEKIAQSTVVVLLDAEAMIEWSHPSLQSALQNIVLVSAVPGVASLPAKEVVEYPLDPTQSTELMTVNLLRVITHIFYHYFFPITSDQHMQNMLTIARKVAKSTASILIDGETGTGKEMIAQYIHQHSAYAAGPFVAINCAAIPETMIEAILFGYEKGAFTNAMNTYIGKFEQANHGTLFLDEIAEMSTELQAKLLRVLQASEFERIGGRETYKVDIRIIAATNQNLEKVISSGQFRPDLYYRLNVVNLKCLPLRQRLDDILPVAQYFIQLYSQTLEKKPATLNVEAIKRLKQHEWPGNIRELQNVIHRAVIMDEDGIIDSADLNLATSADVLHFESSHLALSMRENEAEKIVKVLEETKGCRLDAAKKLMISPRTLRYKISKLKAIGLDIP